MYFQTHPKLEKNTYWPLTINFYGTKNVTNYLVLNPDIDIIYYYHYGDYIFIQVTKDYKNSIQRENSIQQLEMVLNSLW